MEAQEPTMKVVQPSPDQPESVPPAEIDVTSPKRFINRELSWLQFNRRVLEEAFNKAHPLMERLRFLSISASNLDEFYMVRVAGLKAQVATGVSSESPDKMTPVQQLQAIDDSVAKLRRQQQRSAEEILAELDKEGIELVVPDKLTKYDRSWLSKRY